MSDSQMDDNKNEWTDSEEQAEHKWVVVGFVSDRVTADFVIESLRSYEIPAVLNSKSGFFGSIGMTSMELPFSGGVGSHEILTIAEKVVEAGDIAGMVAGDKWEPVGSTE